MIINFLKTSVRNIIRHKLFSAINIIGFAISMSIGLLLISILNDVSSYDRFHERRDQIYRVISTSTEEGNNIVHLATTSVKAGRTIRETFPEIKDLVIVRHGFSGDLVYEDKSISINDGLWTEQSFLDVFSFQLLSGDLKTALKEPYSVVLTEVTAKKIFGEIDPVGKTVVFKTNGSSGKAQYQITGVLKNIPKFSHLQFDALGSFSTLDILERNNNEFLKWDNIWSNFVYVILPGTGSVEKFKTDLNNLCDRENAVIHHNRVKVSLEVQPVSDIVLEKNLDNEFSRRVPLIFVRILIVLSALVLLSAFFNYSNLSIARSLERSHEIAIRKVNGAKRTEVIIQFIVEAIIISSVSLVMALAIFMSMRSMFFSQFPDLRSRLSLDLSPVLIVYFIIFGGLTGLVAGALPGFYYGKVSAIAALKNITPVIMYPRINMRKSLIIIQYVFSLIFITSTLIFIRQYKNAVGYDLGFNTNNILNIKVPEEKSELLQKELAGIPEVTNLSRSFMITSIGDNYYIYSKYAGYSDSVKSWYNIIDENYLPVFGFKLKYGRNFIPTENSDGGEVIVNEKLIKMLNVEKGDAQNAIGKFLIAGTQKLQIVGIVNDFHYSTLEKEIGPFLLRYSNKGFHYINAKILSSDISATTGKIDKIWKTIDPVHPPEAEFYSDQIKMAYSHYKSMVRLIGFLAVLEIIISSIGLLGMVVFSTEIRIKEIGVRKVFGADVNNLIGILGGGFISLILFSALIALPVVYLLFEKIVLRQVVYHSPVGAFELVSGSLLVIMISFIIISTQIYRIARTKPSDLLRNE